RSFERGALILLGTSAVSYLLGLLRDRTLAGTFGASDQLDAYQAAFIIPDIIFNLFLAGALTAAFIPVFTDLTTKRRHRQAAELAGTLLVGGLLLLFAVGLVAWFLAPSLTAFIAPGFSLAKRELLADLTRIMLLSPLLFMVSNLLGGMLVSSKRFFFYGLSPALYNLGIILGAWLLAPTIGIHGVAIGTVLGALLHLATRLIDLKRSNLKIIPSLTFSPPFRKVIKLILPRVVGLSAVQVQLWAFVAIASTLEEGAVTIYSLARNFQSFPVSLIGIALATSLFPLLAQSVSLHNRRQYLRSLIGGSLTTLLLVVPAALLIYIWRTPLISFLIGTGQFDETAVALTAAALGVYTLSIPTESLVHILARAFYALHNTIIPVSISLITITVSVSGAYFAAQRFGVIGIPAGFAAGTALQVVLLASLLWFSTTAKRFGQSVAQA
ncbi:murein biosynthesis integral membrane protein MurJ, partial [Patescibacteria group bacterium]|nr:murein biosynthesis integral membrane protein MurJ [Patescibacteria group bacterium]